VQALADQHPDRAVQLETAWAAAARGDARGYQALQAACAVPQEASAAMHYLTELGAEGRIPLHARSDDFKAISEMCQWLAHPNELGSPPHEIRQVDTRELFWPPTNDHRKLWVRARATVMSPTHMGGIEWIVDAQGCSADALRSAEVLHTLFEQIISGLKLRTIGKTRWHQFPGSGRISGLRLLSESHLACHTFPEFGSICLNLFCCMPHARWDFESQFEKLFAAKSVQVRMIQRKYAAAAEPVADVAASEAR